MADIDEDSPIIAPPDPADTDLSDETQDFRFLSTFAPASRASHPTLPRRGEKDFEHHGTLSQTSTLTASRDAMHAALSVPRVHNPKNLIVGVYDAATGTDDNNDASSSTETTTMMTRVIIEHPRGPNLRTIGKSDARGRLMLLPEEALYMVERGGLDLRWRGVGEREEGVEKGEEGIPMSLQAAYAGLLGKEGLTLERYLVYAGLKRGGYVVRRGPAWFAEDYDADEIPAREVGMEEDKEKQALGVFARFYKALFDDKGRPDMTPSGPLVTPGFYRSYDDIYRLLTLIPAHDPSQPTDRETKLRSSASMGQSTCPTHPRIRPAFYVWKPTSDFKKTAPPPPDFRIAVMNAREEGFPVLEQLDELLQSVPYDPPPPGSEGQTYRRLKHGWRNVILAVVDQGVVSYIRVADAGFGKERIFENRGRGRGGKRGRGRGGGRGRGRGR